jgi:hypothetical protein
MAPITIHFFFPEPAEWGGLAIGVSEMYWEQIAPARESPLAAVTRI